MESERREGCFLVPRRVAVCGYCGADLTIQPTGWTMEGRTGRWSVDCADVDCTAEPDWDDPAWWDWDCAHGFMPYVYHLPQHERAVRWLNRARNPRLASGGRDA